MLTDYSVITKLVLAAILGGIIGMEREMHGRAAGWRTHILVCVGSCLCMLVNFFIFETYSKNANIDPTRIAAQVISGIGFLGAGTIIRYGASVRGLTTAASLWAAAGIGLAVGCGFYQGALMATLIVLIALFVFTKIERRFVRKSLLRVLQVHSAGKIAVLSEIKDALIKNQAEIIDFEVKKEDSDKGVDIELAIKMKNINNADTIISSVIHISGVTEAKWALE